MIARNETMNERQWRQRQGWELAAVPCLCALTDCPCLRRRHPSHPHAFVSIIYSSQSCIQRAKAHTYIHIWKPRGVRARTHIDTRLFAWRRSASKLHWRTGLKNLWFDWENFSACPQRSICPSVDPLTFIKFTVCLPTSASQFRFVEHQSPHLTWPHPTPTDLTPHHWSSIAPMRINNLCAMSCISCPIVLTCMYVPWRLLHKPSYCPAVPGISSWDPMLKTLRRTPDFSTASDSGV